MSGVSLELNGEECMKFKETDVIQPNKDDKEDSIDKFSYKFSSKHDHGELKQIKNNKNDKLNKMSLFLTQAKEKLK